MKRSRVSYDEWECIISKDLKGRQVDSELFRGYIGLINIREVSNPQIWKFNGDDIVVCDEGIKWLSILPKDDFYCITAMMNEQGTILVWYIDMIAGQGVDVDGVPYFDDLYLDLVVYPDGTIVVDDMDELEDALEQGDITQQYFNLAIATSKKLKMGLLADIKAFTKFTNMCYGVVRY